MKVSIDDIFTFYKVRINCHVRAVNYFASLLGYAFPEHDGDKVAEPMRTGYAYIFYNSYHPNLHLTDKYYELVNDAKQTHYKHAPHHIQYYNNVSEIPDIEIYEMVSDWASANFEQINIIHDKNAPSFDEWFAQNMAQLPWTQHQLDLIHKSIETIKEKMDKDTVINIWQDLVKII